MRVGTERYKCAGLAHVIQVVMKCPPVRVAVQEVLEGAQLFWASVNFPLALLKVPLQGNVGVNPLAFGQASFPADPLLVVLGPSMYHVDETSPWLLTGADFFSQMHLSIKEFFPAAQPVFPFLLSESFIKFQNLCMQNHLHFQEVEVPKKEKGKRTAMLVNLYLSSSLLDNIRWLSDKS